MEWKSFYEKEDNLRASGDVLTSFGAVKEKKQKQMFRRFPLAPSFSPISQFGHLHFPSGRTLPHTYAGLPDGFIFKP
jgi:hypothetical protein